MVRTLPFALLALLALTACGGSQDSGDSAAAGATPTLRLDPQRVPADLRHLVPLAEQWGIGDDIERMTKVDRATDTEREQLRVALDPHHARITAWLDSFGQSPMPDEAAAFMYMQLALEEMPVGGP